MKYLLILLILFSTTGYSQSLKALLMSQELIAASVTTAIITSIDEVEALGGGNVLGDGGDPVTQRGVCWSTSQNPTTADFTTSNGSGTGVFASDITVRNLNTTYYVRAYATNSATFYGNQVSYTTPNPTLYTYANNYGLIYQVYDGNDVTYALGTSSEVDAAYAVIAGGGIVVGTEVVYVTDLTLEASDFIYTSSGAVIIGNNGYFQLYRSNLDVYYKVEHVVGKVVSMVQY